MKPGEWIALGGLVVAVLTFAASRLGPKASPTGTLKSVGSCVERIENGTTRRANYMVTIDNTGAGPLAGVEVSVDYYGGDEAKFDMRDFHIDPSVDSTVSHPSKSGTLISLTRDLPPKEHLTLHVADVVASSEKRDLPVLTGYVRAMGHPSQELQWPCSVVP